MIKFFIITPYNLYIHKLFMWTFRSTILYGREIKINTSGVRNWKNVLCEWKYAMAAIGEICFGIVSGMRDILTVWWNIERFKFFNLFCHIFTKYFTHFWCFLLFLNVKNSKIYTKNYFVIFDSNPEYQLSSRLPQP